MATVTGVLTHSNYQNAIYALEQRDGFENLDEPEGITISGTTTHMQGPTFNAVPIVLSDGYTIKLTVITSLNEFLGYYNSTKSAIAGHETVSANSPRFQTREFVTTVNLWDGQTVVIGNFPKGFYQGFNKIDGQTKVTDKELLIFITVTIVDEAGNRVHSDDELPFAQQGIPTQPTQSK